MIKKTVTYNDYNDVERTEDFYFNLTETELSQMALGTKGDLGEIINGIIKAKDVPAIADYFKKLLEMSYGVKTADGRGFRKSAELLEDFKACPAYDIIYMSLARDENAAAEFVNGIMPKSVREEAAKPALKPVE